ncbi:MAG: AAA family ATPase [Anaerolineales bacterium]
MTLEIAEVAALSRSIIQEVEKAVVGKRAALEKIMAAFLSTGGHVLLEDYPGLAKTLIANSFATALGMTFKRIQFTPDLLPGDITGGYIYDRSQNQFVLRKGSIFANIILADEINRASPKTQSAMLEAMQEYQVTLEGETIPLPEPFITIATQNPIEYEGTFPLPEAQLDRFMIKLSVGYPSREDERQILQSRQERKHDRFELQPITDSAGLLAMQSAVEQVFIDKDLELYIVDLVQQTREHKRIALGSSPRGALALLKLGRAWAAMHERSYVLPDDIKHFVQPVLSHRIILDPDLWNSRVANENILDEIVNTVPVPVIENI